MRFAPILFVSLFIILHFLIGIMEDITNTFPQAPLTSALSACLAPALLLAIIAFASRNVFENVHQNNPDIITVFVGIIVLLFVMTAHHNTLVEAPKSTKLSKEVIGMVTVIAKKTLFYSYTMIFMIAHVSFFKKEHLEKNGFIS